MSTPAITESAISNISPSTAVIDSRSSIMRSLARANGRLLAWWLLCSPLQCIAFATLSSARKGQNWDGEEKAEAVCDELGMLSMIGCLYSGVVIERILYKITWFLLTIPW